MGELDERRYTEKEVAAALRRAAQLQEREGEPPTHSGGSTRGEIERICEEVGIDSRHIATALAEIGQFQVSEDNRGQSHWLGAPPEYMLERSIPGTLGPDGWDTLVGILNAEFRQSIPGVVNGDIRTWHWKHDTGHVHFSAIQASDGVRLRMTLHIDPAIVAGLVPAVLAWFATTTLLFSADALRPWLSMVLSAVALVGLVAGFRAFTGKWWRKDQHRTARLMNQLAEAITPVITRSGILASQPEEPNLPVACPQPDPVDQNLSLS